MLEVAKTEFYRLAVDKTKKRVYNSVYGVWGERPDLAQFDQDWDKVLKFISKGYTMLTDATQFRLLSVGWAKSTIETRKKLIQAGVSKIAEVLPKSTILKMQFDTISHHTEINTRIFFDQKEAEAWLDKKEE